MYKDSPIDLFGQVPISEQDLENWVCAVAPRWLTPERSYQNYLAAYSIADKVRAAKLAGTFESIIAAPNIPYHARLSLACLL
jgi:hypothetical protein